MLRLFLTAAFSSIFSIALAATDPAAVESVSLDFDRPHTQALRADQALLFDFTAEANKSYLLEIDQGGVDVAITVQTPGGASRSYDSPLFRDENELILIDAAARGTYSLHSSSIE